MFKPVNAPVEMSSGDAISNIRKGVGPDRVACARTIDLRGSDVVHLPREIVTGGDLDLSGCSMLETMPKRISARGALFMSRCPNVTSMPDELLVGSMLVDRMMVAPTYIRISARVPETVIASMTGRRIREVVDHALLRDRRFMDWKITGADSPVYNVEKDDSSGSGQLFLRFSGDVMTMFDKA